MRGGSGARIPAVLPLLLPLPAPTGGLVRPAAWYEGCVRFVNGARAREGLPALRRWAGAEACTDAEAAADQLSGAANSSACAGAAGAGAARASAACAHAGHVNSLPNVGRCIDVMWLEKSTPEAGGSGPGITANGSCNPHAAATAPSCDRYYALRGGGVGQRNSYTKVACGFSVAGGLLYVKLNFHADPAGFLCGGGAAVQPADGGGYVADCATRNNYCSCAEDYNVGLSGVATFNMQPVTTCAARDCPKVTLPPAPPAPSGDDDDDNSALIGGLCGGLGGALVLMIICLCVYQRCGGGAQGQGAGGGGSGAAGGRGDRAPLRPFVAAQVPLAQRPPPKQRREEPAPGPGAADAAGAPAAQRQSGASGYSPGRSPAVSNPIDTAFGGGNSQPYGGQASPRLPPEEPPSPPPEPEDATAGRRFSEEDTGARTEVLTGVMEEGEYSQRPSLDPSRGAGRFSSDTARDAAGAPPPLRPSADSARQAYAADPDAAVYDAYGARRGPGGAGIPASAYSAYSAGGPGALAQPGARPPPLALGPDAGGSASYDDAGSAGSPGGPGGRAASLRSPGRSPQWHRGAVSPPRGDRAEWA